MDLMKSLNTYIIYGDDKETIDFIVKSYNNGMTFDMIRNGIDASKRYMVDLVETGFYSMEDIGLKEDLHIKKCFQNYGITNDKLEK